MQSLAPHYAKAATALKTAAPDVIIAKASWDVVRYYQRVVAPVFLTLDVMNYTFDVCKTCKAAQPSKVTLFRRVLRTLSTWKVQRIASSQRAHPLSLLLQVDATQEEALGTKFGVSGYPTLKWFIDGELASDYNGPREA